MYEFRIHTNWPLISKAISFIQGGDFNFISEQNWIGEQFNRLQECGFAFCHCSCWLKLCLCSQFIWGLRVAASVFKDGWTVTFNKCDLFAIYMLLYLIKVTSLLSNVLFWRSTADFTKTDRMQTGVRNRGMQQQMLLLLGWSFTNALRKINRAS